MKKDSWASPLVEAHHSDGAQWLGYHTVRGQTGRPVASGNYVEVRSKDPR